MRSTDNRVGAPWSLAGSNPAPYAEGPGPETVARVLLRSGVSMRRHRTPASSWALVSGLALIMLAAPTVSEAQVCTRGKPCGNSCIARDRVCRAGPGTARQGGSNPAPVPAAAPSVTVPEGATFVASSRGQVYYWVGCSAWRQLAQTNLRFFRTRAEAEAAGYRPSTTRGCEGPSEPPPG